MARIELADVETMDDVDRAQYTRIPINLVRATLRTEGCTDTFISLAMALRQTKLNPKQYELVILRVAALSRCAYERMQHLPPALKVGWSEADIEAMEHGQGERLSAPDAALLAFVDECVGGVRVSDRTFWALRRYLSEGAVADVTLLIGFYMMIARFVETLDVDLDSAPSDRLLSYS